jgi:hypothetical protein
VKTGKGMEVCSAEFTTIRATVKSPRAAANKHEQRIQYVLANAPFIYIYLSSFPAPSLCENLKARGAGAVI